MMNPSGRLLGAARPFLLMQTLVLLHGFAETAAVWQPLAEPLTADANVLLPDYSEQALPNLDAYADWLRAWLDAQSAGPVVLVGHSMGGYIALAFAERHPDRLRGLGLMHSTAYADSQERKQKRLEAIQKIDEKGVEIFLRNFVPLMYAESFARQFPERLESHVQAVKHLPAEALKAAMRAMRERPDRRDVLRNAPFPVLFLIGMADRSVSPQDALEQVSLPARHHEVVLEDIGHSGMTEAPEGCLLAIRDFLDSVESSTQ